MPTPKILSPNTLKIASDNTGFAISFILVLIFAAGLFGIITYFKFFQTPKSQQMITDTKTTTKISPKDEAVDWKTLKSDRFYIEFKYPSDWQYLKDARSSQVKRDPNFRIYNDSNELVTDDNGCAFYISSHGGSEGPTAYIKNTQISIDNKAFTQRSWSKTEGGNDIFTYYFSDTFKSKVDPLIIWSWTPDSNCQTKIEQIISTIKFL